MTQTPEERKKYNEKKYKAQYYIDNKERYLQYARDYKELNREKLKEQRKTRYTKINCECGAIISKHNLAVHIQTNKHKKILESELSITV